MGTRATSFVSHLPLISGFRWSSGVESRNTKNEPMPTNRFKVCAHSMDELGSFLGGEEGGVGIFSLNKIFILN